MLLINKFNRSKTHVVTVIGCYDVRVLLIVKRQNCNLEL